ncbi:MAG: hypothetical protein IJU92_02420 [Spirochaetaceae bacterium]|nr:hypothetical protein [Spirochaetaceae bacterium]
MKKYLWFIAIISFCLWCTSCFEYTQAVSYSQNNYNITYNFMLSKALFAMSGQNINDFLDQLSNDGAFSDEVKEQGQKPTQIETDDLFGITGSFSIPLETNNQNNITQPDFTDLNDLLPKKQDDKLYIKLLLANQARNELLSEGKNNQAEKISKDFAALLLSSAKCKITIDKSLAKNITEAYFEGTDGKKYIVKLIDYGTYWSAEIPFMKVFYDDQYNFEYLILKVSDLL